MTHNQDWVLARFREDAAKDDPAPYTRDGDRVWLRTGISPHPGWHDVVVRGGAVAAVYWPAWYGYNMVKWLSEAQKRKIVGLYA